MLHLPDFYKAKQLIELGEAAAPANIDEIRKLSGTVSNMLKFKRKGKNLEKHGKKVIH